jgi:hypothetical protein
MHCQHSPNTVCRNDKSNVLSTNNLPIAELRESIEPVISDLVALLKDHDSDVCAAVTTTLSTFASYCAYGCQLSYDLFLMVCIQVNSAMPSGFPSLM